MDDGEKLASETAPYRKPAVKWLSIVQLLRTAVEILKVWGYAKGTGRRKEIAKAPSQFYQLTTGTDDVRVDFLADTGDGFDATFATALCVAGHPSLKITDKAKPRADLLVLGGDLVYPVAKESRYEERFTSVFRHAAKLAGMGDEKPPMVALPGNHDWYDGLKSFLKMMRGNAATTTGLIPVPAERKDVGGWGAFQSRSYFAVQLTPDWWLWGIDSQLDAPIDDDQLDYFRAAKDHLDGADILLCTATPSWIEAAGNEPYRAPDGSPFHSLLAFINGVLGEEDRDRVRLLLTGDKHHYAHYAPKQDTGFRPELVTCGGGGAFLSSTHHLPKNLNPVWQPDSTHYELDKAYPTRAESEALVAPPKFLAAGVRNGPTLPALAGIIGAALMWTFSRGLVPTLIGGGVLLVLLGLYAKRGKPKHVPKRPAGLALTLGHTFGHLVLAGLAWFVTTEVAGLSLWWSLAAAFLPLAVLGTGVFVTYLHIADRLGWHTLEAFSGMGFDGYKSHLRMSVSKAEIKITVFGMDSVPDNRRDGTNILPTPRIIDDDITIGHRDGWVSAPTVAAPGLGQ